MEVQPEGHCSSPALKLQGPGQEVELPCSVRKGLITERSILIFLKPSFYHVQLFIEILQYF